MCCIERELIDETRFSITPFFFTFKGWISSVTDVVGQQTDWQRLVHLHYAEGEDLKAEVKLELKGSKGWEYRRSKALGFKQRATVADTTVNPPTS